MIPLDGMADLPQKQKQKLMESMETMQAKDNLRLYNSLVERCFSECVSEFRRRELDVTEEKCVSKCAEKFIKHAQRVGTRFGELSSELEQQLKTQMEQMKKPNQYRLFFAKGWRWQWNSIFNDMEGWESFKVKFAYLS